MSNPTPSASGVPGRRAMSRKILVYKTVHQRAVGVARAGLCAEGGAVAQDMNSASHCLCSASAAADDSFKGVSGPCRVGEARGPTCELSSGWTSSSLVAQANVPIRPRASRGRKAFSVRKRLLSADGNSLAPTGATGDERGAGALRPVLPMPGGTIAEPQPKGAPRPPFSWPGPSSADCRASTAVRQPLDPRQPEQIHFGSSRFKEAGIVVRQRSGRH